MRDIGFSGNRTATRETSATGRYRGAHVGAAIAAHCQARDTRARRIDAVTGYAGATGRAAIGERIGDSMICDSANAIATACYGHASACYGQAIANGQARAWKFPKPIPKNGF